MLRGSLTALVTPFDNGGAFDEKAGYRRVGHMLLHPKTEVTGGVLEPACADLMKAFFKKKRSLK